MLPPGPPRAALSSQLVITKLRTFVYRLLGDLLVAGGVVLLLWDGPDALLARRLTWQVVPGYYRAAVMDIVMPGVPVEDVIVSVRQKDPAFPFS